MLCPVSQSWIRTQCDSETRCSIDHCTARARSREYSSLEIAFEFFSRSSFSSSSATLKPTTWRSSSRACWARWLLPFRHPAVLA